MKSRRDTATVVWIMLVAMTCISIVLEQASLASSIAASLVVLIALLKARLIFINFMELDRKVKPYRVLFEVWAAMAVAIILGGYWYAAF